MCFYADDVALMRLWLMAVASNGDLYESTQQIYCNTQHFIESERGDERLLRVLKAFWRAGEAVERLPLSIPPWKSRGLLLSLRLMETTSSELILKNLDNVTIISKSGLQMLLGLSRFQERAGTDTSPLCSGCSPGNVFLMLLLYLPLIFGESVETEDESIESFSLHHIRQLLCYPSAGSCLSGSLEKAQKLRLSAYSAKKTLLIPIRLPPRDAATAPCSGTNQSQWHRTTTQVVRVPDCASRRNANYPMLCCVDKNHH